MTDFTAEQLEAGNDWLEEQATPDCAECDQPEGGRIPRHTADQTVWLCSHCDRITPTA